MSKEYDPFKSMTFTYDKCFLCGETLNKENSSDEHVFPKWSQNINLIYGIKNYIC